jgi:hypothetical protein
MNAATTALLGACLGYVLLAHGIRLASMARALPGIRRGRGFIRDAMLPPVHPAFEPPVSILLVAGDLAAVARIAPLLDLDYPEYEVVVVHHDADAATLAALEAEFALAVFPEAHWRRLPAQAMRAIYHSRAQPRLRVLDPEPGSLADALNAGVNAARFPLVCMFPDDSAPGRDVLHRLAEPFIDGTTVVATCAPAHAPRPTQWLQRLAGAFALRDRLVLMGRSAAGAVLDVPAGALLLRKETVVEALGFIETAGAEADVLARMQAAWQSRGLAARVAFVTEPVCRLATAPSRSAAMPTLYRHGWRLARRPLEKIAFALDAYRPLLDAIAYGTVVLLWAFGRIDAKTLGAFAAMSVALTALGLAAALALEAAYLEPAEG